MVIAFALGSLVGRSSALELKASSTNRVPFDTMVSRSSAGGDCEAAECSFLDSLYYLCVRRNEASDGDFMISYIHKPFQN